MVWRSCTCTPLSYPLLRGPAFLDTILLIQSTSSILYIKPLFPINKQISIDSFLDWEGLHCDFSLTLTYPPYAVPPPFRGLSVRRTILKVLLGFIYLRGPFSIWNYSVITYFHAQNGHLYGFHSLHAFTCGDDRIVFWWSQLWIEFRSKYLGDIHDNSKTAICYFYLW